jgi:hypothetical protein
LLIVQVMDGCLVHHLLLYKIRHQWPWAVKLCR